MSNGLEKREERILFIDVLRGYAILMMLQGHTVGVVLGEDWRKLEYPVYAVWWYLTGLTAPVFFLSAGMVFAYLMVRGEERGQRRGWKGIKRGVSLLALGYVLQFSPQTFRDLGEGDFAAFGRVFGRSHVLHTIGLSLWVLVAGWVLSGRRAKRYGGVCFSLGLVGLLSGPMVAKWDGWGRVAGTFVSENWAAFPLLPWCGYALVGASLGVWARSLRWYHSPRMILKVMAGGAVVMFFGHQITLGFWAIFGDPAWVTEYGLGGRFFRAGEAIFFVGLVAGGCEFLRRRGWEKISIAKGVSRCGQETLTIYFLHVFVVYSAVFGVGLSKYFRREFNAWESVMTAALVVVGFIILAMKLPQLRKRIRLLGLIR